MDGRLYHVKTVYPVLISRSAERQPRTITANLYADNGDDHLYNHHNVE